MTGSNSTFLTNKLLDVVFGRTSYLGPTSVYFGLLLELPFPADGLECFSPSYRRVEIVNTLENFPLAEGGKKTNANTIIFPESQENWGSIVGFGIYDQMNEGNLLLWGKFVRSTTVEERTILRIPENSLNVSYM